MTESILQIKDLKKSFGDNQILKGISLDVKQGEVVVILGSRLWEIDLATLYQWLGDYSRRGYSPGWQVYH